MILAAGLGTRLGALTQSTPKALIDVGGKAMLEIVAENLKRAGVSELMINLHYLPQQIRDYCKRAKNFGLKIHFSEEPEILGTGGGLRKVAEFFRNEDAFIVHNCDVYTDANLNAHIATHCKSGALGTLLVREGQESSYLLFDEEGVLVGWEKEGGVERKLVRTTKVQRACYTGIQVLSPKIFDYMKTSQGAFSIIDTYMAAAVAGDRLLSASLGAAFWIDMGSPEKLELLRKRIVAKRD